MNKTQRRTGRGLAHIQATDFGSQAEAVQFKVPGARG